VTHDLLGLFGRFTPKFVRKYADLNTVMQNAFTAYISDVQDHRFPTREETVEMPEEEWESLIKDLEP